jgi:hypothetical protein
LAFLPVVLSTHWSDIIEFTVTTEPVGANVIKLDLVAVWNGMAIRVTMSAKATQNDRLFIVRQLPL